MIKVGITGGIGSGKSVVATLFRLYGIPVYMADEESKKLLDTSACIKNKLRHLLGDDIYTEQGLDRKRLASLIFNDAALLEEVNGIIHPEVRSHFADWTLRQGGAICSIESAILFESGFDELVDKVLTVYAPLELRLARVQKRDNSPVETIMHRVNSQLSDEIKKERSDFVVYNDDRHALIPQVERLVGLLNNPG